MKENLYDVLGITTEEKKLSGEEFNNVVKRQYRALAQTCHPDKYQDPDEKLKAKEKFTKLAESKEILSDPQKRMHYDMTGDSSSFNYSQFDTHADLNDIINSFLNHGMGGGMHFRFNQRGHQPQQYRGEDVVIKISLDIKDILSGCTKKYRYKRNVVCTSCGGGSAETCIQCNGSGMMTTTQQMGFAYVQQTTTCPYCRGTGRFVQGTSCKSCGGSGVELKEDTISVDIPKGLTEGNVLRKSGAGHEIPKHYQGVPGDLQIIISKINAGEFQIDKYNLVVRKKVPILDIITGTTIELTMPMGKTVKIDVPKGHPNGNALELVEYGLPCGNTGRKGNMYVVIDHKFPTTVDKSEMKHIEELKKSKNFK